ncbi:MAG: type transport system permease protein [Phycisphaerales bacterium]|nr:type transport system permease protein [Phycisphaerales bacterium]
MIGALLTPLMFWLLIGGGMGHSFSAPGAAIGANTDYLKYFFPGTVLMILLFTAIFSTISVIEDRREGFLQGVLVAPVGRVAIVGGKVLGGAVLATAQALLFILLGWATHVITLSPLHLLGTVVILFVTGVGLTALALCIAWPMSSTQGFHVVMNLFLVPLWFLSGALFPIRDDTPRLLKGLMLANPLSYALASLREVLTQHRETTMPGTLPIWFSVTLGATILTLGLAVWVARSRSSSDAV